MLSYVWPLLLVILSNVFYQICAKSVPDTLNPFASLTVTYAIGAVVSIIMFFVIGKGTNIIHEYSKVNWAPIVMGLSVVGLEVGYIFMYKNGWQISTAQIVQAALLAIILIIIGYFIYKEEFTVYKLAGIALCIGGLALINFKK